MTCRCLMLWVLLAASRANASQPPANVLALNTTWRAEDGTSTDLSAWKSRRYVLSFIYTSCPTTCPLTTQKLKRLDAMLAKAGKPLDLVVVSLDPAGDTPQAVAQYRVTHALQKAKRWHVLVGDEAQLRGLTTLLGFRYSKNPETGVIVHDNSVYLVGPQGEVEASMSSIDESLAPFIEAIPSAKAVKRTP